MAVRRMARLTNAHSKKWENHEYHLAFHFLYYNFCRVHMTIKTTPAVKAGVATEVWTEEKLLDELATQQRTSAERWALVSFSVAIKTARTGRKPAIFQSAFGHRSDYFGPSCCCSMSLSGNAFLLVG